MSKITFEGYRVGLTAKAGSPGPKSFSGIAYTGAQLRVAMYYRPVVLDLAGVKAETAEIAILRHHDPEQIVGHGTPRIASREITVEGKLSGGGDAAKEVEASAAKGFPWKLSVGIDPTNVEFVEAGSTALANGQTWTGPLNIVRAGNLIEISFVPIAADSHTEVKVAASAGKECTMEFSAWLAASGFEPDQLTDTQRASLRASYDREMGGNGATAAGELKVEAARLAGIRATCRDFPAIEEEAILAGWSKDQAELAVLRASRSKPPVSTSSRRTEATQDVLQCALLAHLGAHDIAEKSYDANTLQCARDLRIKHVMDVAEAGLRLAHVEPRGGKNDIIRAGWSTGTLTNLLGDSANKIATAVYGAFPSVARKVAKQLSAKDFKTATGIRLTSSSQTFSEVGGAGSIEHGDLLESTHTYSISTFAKMFAVTRQNIINDDLGALNEIPRLLAIGAAQKLESIFWALVGANTGSFHAESAGNYLTDALGETGLGNAVELMRKLTNEEGEPIAVEPKFLVVPPSLETVADGLFASSNVVIAGDTDASRTSGNTFAGKYLPLVVPHLENSNYSGHSATRWFLFADPATIAAYAIAFLNRQQTPVIESADSDFDTLGLQFRGYHDFGAAQVDPAGAVMSTGAGG